MIIIGGRPFEPGALISKLSREKAGIVKLMNSYKKVYRFNTLAELEFMLEAKILITRAARLLADSGAEFETFKNSRCNPEYWNLHESGAFFLKEGISPHQAIDDIYHNGKLYAFECATAMVIVFYKAVSGLLGPLRFDRLFKEMYLFDWEYNKNLALETSRSTDFLPGDCVYFRNPDYHPDTPEWQGENCIVLDVDLYFAHGIGIGTGEEIMAVLNSLRKPFPEEPAYLEDVLTRLDALVYYSM
ncbi:protein-glutamine gamma-glutamyltransferase [Peribacillus sp. SCS-37]|uniref:protein-glutamine gamma-glutamyltransferase n=1 Tax=Paraperibacillus esterisolvens TaxID=3115296 RepID=UPI0039065DAB